MHTLLREDLQDSVLVQAFRVLDILCLSFFSLNSRDHYSLHVQCSYEVDVGMNTVLSDAIAFERVSDNIIEQRNNELPYAIDINGTPLKLNEYRYIDLVLSELNSQFPTDVAEIKIEDSGSWHIKTSAGITFCIQTENTQETEQWRVVQTSEHNKCVHFVCYGARGVSIERA